MKKKLMIICPMLREFHCARECFGAVEQEEECFRTATASFGGYDIRILCSGVVTEKSAVLIKKQFGTPDLLIDSGTAGGLSGVEMGDVLAGEAFLYSRNAEIKQILPDWAKAQDIPPVRILTVDEPVLDGDVHSRFGDLAEICTMESYHLASAARLWGCDFFSIRVVTDLADEYTTVNFKKKSRPYCMHLYTLLKQILQNGSH